MTTALALSEVITSADVYWLTRLDSIGGACITAAIVFSMASALTVVASLIHEEPKFRRWLWLTVPIAVIGALGSVLVPTTKQAVAILVIPKIANNEDLQGLGADTVNVAREWLEELRPKAKTEGGGK